MRSAHAHIHADSHNCQYKLSTPIVVVIMHRFYLNNGRMELVVDFCKLMFAVLCAVRHDNIAAYVRIHAGLSKCNDMTDVGGERERPSCYTDNRCC
jgi:metal-dependent HD superfamily phosphatase/phosphodiesterase